MLSIPDWSVTPFGAGATEAQIALEIDQFNEANKKVAEKYDVHYINITPGTREAACDAGLIADDGLHPSAKEYQKMGEEGRRNYDIRLIISEPESIRKHLFPENLLDEFADRLHAVKPFAGQRSEPERSVARR